ncbi:hypothetical protein HY224_02820, partial [Candidatus Uhrbacteria bacterium]|nr:hypothetical protein [Candidatus Uhrbacteria bacterium]
ICCGIVWGCPYAYYSFNCHTSFEIFGCTGVRGKKYCILNKQYSKEEYDKLKARLIAYMKETGEWGEFFPPSVSPFNYNETLAQEYTPLSRAMALDRGFKWQDKMPGVFGKETLDASKVPDTIAEVEDQILNEVLACSQCQKNYKITAFELAFYRKHQLPVPLSCPDCRYHARLALRLPHLLWPRQCGCQGTASGDYKNTVDHFHGSAKCPNKFESPFALARPEMVYCEKCYQAEVV